jgi:hypothetical protein
MYFAGISLDGEVNFESAWITSRCLDIIRPVMVVPEVFHSRFSKWGSI